ncbi:PSD1 and planctomycete cytochrome C domain-containing protein [Rubritalea marina]|uniref:PSD1 and planctomycete cytochrome C domain-containing protein n=1 Tax=Rubritalea marina TaxID=361055 RepID=UPI000374809A|nr:PSD1 and planctomycete cytochrome C domain-containing protein [Rubritalea marina]
MHDKTYQGNRHQAWLAIASLSLFLSHAHAGDDLDFNRDVQPILSDKCYFCHGPDVENNKADLRLDIRESAIAAGAIIPGDSKKSPIIQRILTQDADDIMPPPDAHKSLTQKDKDTLISWVDAGAKYDKHWSYRKVKNPGETSIDAIVVTGLEKKDLKLSPKAKDETLLRRVFLDTLGLPPTPEQAELYLSNPNKASYAKLVDTLLASPHFGENMATDWLDAVRFTDSVGYHGDQYRDASPYRDYVIHAFNTNKPYDAFVTEQVAGDLLPNATIQQRVAASFNRLNQISQEGGIQDKEYIKKYQAERIRTTSTALLGSTLACAECHDHKYDPFTAKDFYAFGAFFADILEKGAWNGSGKYQEEDISNYLAGPDVYEKPGMGPTLKVPNRTFLHDAPIYEAERAKRLNAMHQGTPAANRSFDQWLQRKEQLQRQGVPIAYPVQSPDNYQHTQLSPDFNMSNGARFVFNVNAGKVDLRHLNRIGVSLQFPDHEYIFYWGFHAADPDQPKRSRHRKGGMPAVDKVVELAFNINELRPAHRSQNPSKITFLSGQKDTYSDTNAFSNVRLETIRHQVPVGLLSQHNRDLLEKHLAGTATDDETLQLRHGYLADHSNTADQTKLQLAYRAINKYLDGVRETPATISAKPREIKVLPRGNWMDETGEVVLPATPHFLDLKISATEDQPLNRLDLAKWMVHRDNPLTARTYVNRVWAQFFGTPLSSAPEDLGLQGEYPLYPELLDFLAYEFMDSGWNVKHLVKTILLSDVYQQSSKPTPELVEMDPYNRLLARQSPRRLKAENIRDNALAISDLLVTRIGGASARPYQPTGYYQHLNFPRRTYKTNTDENQYRRGVYTHWQRTFLHPMLIAFDAPSRDECAVARPQSNTPLQALNQLNDPSFLEAAGALATGVIGAHPESDKERIEYAYKKALTREPNAIEIDSLKQFLMRERNRFSASPDDATAFLESAKFQPNDSISTTELAAWTSLCRALLNLHETITRY